MSIAMFDLENAILEREIVPFVQPIVALPIGVATEYEILARWIKPDGNIVMPADFIPVVERFGLANLMTLSLVEQSLEIAAGALASEEFRGVSLAFNICPDQLMDSDLFDGLSYLTDRFGVDNNRVTLEITENSRVGDRQVADVSIFRYRSAGFDIALDDFGTGYSSFNDLRDFDIDSVKIDRQFVAALGEQSADAIVASIVRIGRELGLRVVAEGIETLEQEKQLLAVDCQFGQGYLYAKPRPICDVFGIDVAGKKPRAICNL